MTIPHRRSVAGGVFGFALGVWSDWIVRKFDRPEISESEQLSALFGRFNVLIDRLENEGESQGLMAEINSFHLTLKKLGIDTPRLNADDWRAYRGTELRFLRELAPVARDGHLKEAKVLAKRLCQMEPVRRLIKVQDRNGPI